MASNEVRLSVVICNESAMIALEEAVEIARELAEDLTWNDEVRELLEKLLHVAGNIGLSSDGGGDDEPTRFSLSPD